METEEQLSRTTMSPARSLIAEILRTVLAAGLLMSAAADAGDLAIRLKMVHSSVFSYI